MMSGRETRLEIVQTPPKAYGEEVIPGLAISVIGISGNGLR
jgi:hypothetical protein